MASHEAIATVSAAIRALLANSTPPQLAGAEFQVANADSLQSPMADGLAILLYRVSVPGRSQPPGGTSLALDLHYLVTAWNADPIRQQLLLGWAGQMLEASPIFTAAFLNQQAPEPGVFRSDEIVELIAEPLGMQDEAAVWNSVKALQQPSLCYIARGVRIESSDKV